MSQQEFLATCGEVVALESRIDWVGRLLLDGSDGAASRRPIATTMAIVVESTTRSFPISGLTPLSRSAWSGGGEVVMVDVCGSGFDVHATLSSSRAEFTIRWRPDSTRSAARFMMARRFRLLTREALLYYPVLWWASVHGRVPLHAIACTVGDDVALLAGPGGVGKSTLLQTELDAGAQATSDNLCVGDGHTVWGLVEPMRVEGTGGPRTTHGRVEIQLRRRVDHLTPNRVVVVRRGDGDSPALVVCDSEVAARALIAGTYAAGELSRFWGYAATLAAGSGMGPSHPEVSETARVFASRLGCFELRLPRRPGARLRDLLSRVEAIA
jgi:hypothetical protein